MSDKKLICLRKCHAGKVWEVGAETTEQELLSMEGVEEVPAHFKPVGSDEAEEILVDADQNGFTTVAEIKDYLTVKGVSFKSSAKKAELQALLAQTLGAENAPLSPEGKEDDDLGI